MNCLFRPSLVFGVLEGVYFPQLFVFYGTYTWFIFVYSFHERNHTLVYDILRILIVERLLNGEKEGGNR